MAFEKLLKHKYKEIEKRRKEDEKLNYNDYEKELLEKLVIL